MRLFGIAFVWRPWLQHRRHGSTGVLLFRAGGRAQKVRDDRLVTPGLRGWMGAALLAAGLILLVAAQLDLGASWRIGIDEGARPGLVTGGLYAYTRNPIFLALLVTIAGYAALLPTLLSAAMLAGLYVAIRQQIAAEEAYLLRTYGDAYRAYAARVGRLLPGIGKLA